MSNENNNTEEIKKERTLYNRDELAPASCAWTCKADTPVEIRMGTQGIAAQRPFTIMTMIENTVNNFPDKCALAVKRDEKWIMWTYKEYLADIKRAAKSFIKLGLEEHKSVCILGFNSPEWIMSLYGSIHAGGLGVGIYATNNEETCSFIINNCEANIIVVENDAQMKKIQNIRDQIPSVKAVIQYLGPILQKGDNLYTWEEFMKLGDGVEESILNQRIESQAPNKACLLIYTSGTTGNPKGVMCSHDNITWVSSVLKEFLNFTSEGVIVSYLPLSHIAGQILDIHLPALLGFTVYFARPDALKGTLKDSLLECRPTFFFGVPRVWEKLMEAMIAKGKLASNMKKRIGAWAKDIGLRGTKAMMEGQPLPWGWSLAKILVFNKVKQLMGLDRCKYMTSGAAPITEDTVNFFSSYNIPLMSVYGMSECTGPHTLDIPNRIKAGSAGKTLPGCQTKIINKDEDGCGEVCMAGRHVFMGYINMEDKTRETLDEEGWLHSGDIGKLNDEGYVWITGRIKELIVTAGGENVAPIPIEDNIKEALPVVSNCMVVGDYKKFLSCLLTIKVPIDINTGEPGEELTEEAVTWCKSVGSSATKVAELCHNKDEKVNKAIEEGIKKANDKAISTACKVQKFIILPADFSIPGGELGPTLKLRRPIVAKMYKDLIDGFYV